MGTRQCLNVFLCGVIILLTGLMNVANGKEYRIDFKTRPSNPDKLRSWSKNKGLSDPKGKYVLVKEKDGKKALKITSYKKITYFYRSTKITAEAGDTLEINLNAKGKGKGIVGFYFYGLNNRFIENRKKDFAPQSDWKEYKFTFIVKDVNPEKSATAICRLVLGAGTSSEVLFKDVFVLNKSSNEYLCIKTQTRPTVDGTVIGWDGNIPDKCWKDSVWGVDFKKTGSIEAYPDQTRFSFSYDSENLYFTAVCYDRNIEKIKRTAKTKYNKVWADDCVEVFLDLNLPDKRVAHFIINSLGTVYFQWAGGAGQAFSGMQCKAKVYTGRWEIEFALPWKSLGVKAPVEGSVCTMNVARAHRHKGTSRKPNSTWAYLPENLFMNRQFFIPFKFGKTGEKATALKEMTGPVPASVMQQAGLGTLKSKRLIRGINKMVREDYKPVGDPVKLPRITWANPFAGKLLRTLFVLQFVEREVWEMSRRLKMQNADVIYCPHKSRTVFNVGAFALNANEITKNLIGQGEKYDVIVVATDIANNDLVNAIIDNVKAGTGLVYLSSPYAELIPKTFGKILPKPQLFEKAPANYVTRNIAIEGLPYSSKHKPTLDNSGTSANKAIKTIGFGEYGKGKIVNIGYSALTDGLTPHPDRYFYTPKSRAEGLAFFDNQICNQWWENVFSLLMRSVCWAGGYKPDCEIDSVSQSKNMLVVNFDKPVMHDLELESIWDSMKVTSRQEMKGKRINVPRNATSMKIKIPAEIQKCHGVHFCHLILRDRENGKTIDWATGVIQIRSGFTIGSLKTNKKRYKPGEEAQLECEIVNNRNNAEKVELRVLLKDPFKRIDKEITQYTQVKGNKSVVCRISVPLKRALTVQLSLQVELRNAKNELLDCAVQKIYVPKPYVPDDYKLMCNLDPGRGFRDYLYPAYERLLLETGINRIGHSVHNKIFSGYPGFFNFHNVGAAIFYEPRHYSGEKRSGDKYRRHTAKSCINNKKCLERQIKRILLQIPPSLEQGVFCFKMQDEGGLSGNSGNIPEADFCYCATCRKLFKEYAEKLYGTIKKANSEWGTSFKNWDAVVPMVLEEAWRKSDRNYSLWVDYKFFMEDSYLNAFRKVKSKVKAKYPDVKLNLANPALGGNPREPLSGENYYKWAHEEDFVNKYFGIMSTIGYNSFSNRNVPKMQWWGYLEHASRIRYAPWFSAFNGIILNWYWPFQSSDKYDGSRTGNMCLSSYNITHTGRSLAIKETARDLVRGVGKIILGAEPVKRPVAMLYSQASLYTACAEKQVGRYHVSELQWRNLIRGAGYEFNFVAVEELEKQLHNYRVLVLPYSIALSAASQEIIKRFVQSGGIVFCDGTPGCFDDHGRYLNGKGALETVFANASRETIGTAEKIKYENGEIILIDKAPAWMRDWKLFRKVLDQGKVKKGIDSILDLTLKAPAASGNYEIYTFQKGRCRFYGIIGNGYDWGSRVSEQYKPVRICWENKAHIYDVRQQKYLGFTDAITTKIRLNKADFYAAMPYKIKGLETLCEFNSSDWKLHYEARISNSKAEDQVLRVEVYDPEQQLINVYTGNYWAKKGKLKREIPFAFNDKPGKWTIKIIDVISGISEKMVFILPEVTVHGGKRKKNSR